jgi:hypothetical protein
MQTQSIQSELRDFVQFTSRRLEGGDDRLSLEELVRQWRQGTEFAEVVADVQQGIRDEAEGKAQPLWDAFADVRRKLEIADGRE